MVSDEKVCPFCAEQIKAAAVKCKHCGEFLVSSKTSPPLAKSNGSDAERLTEQAPTLAAKAASPGAMPAIASSSAEHTTTQSGELPVQLGNVVVTAHSVQSGVETVPVSSISGVRLASQKERQARSLRWMAIASGLVTSLSALTLFSTGKVLLLPACGFLAMLVFSLHGLFSSPTADQPGTTILQLRLAADWKDFGALLSQVEGEKLEAAILETLSRKPT